MRDYEGMVRAWPCFLVAVILLAGCSRECRTKPQGGASASGPASARGATRGQTEGQTLAYVSSKSAPTEGGDTQSTSGQELTVRMTNDLKYVPPELTITVGQTVVWKNTATVVHTVTADPALAKQRRDVRLPDGAQPFHSGPIAPNATFRHTFDVPGLYVYFCIPHEADGMVGRINVREK